MTSPDIHVDPATLDSNAATLRDLSADLQAGQFDMFLLNWAGAPRSHPDVARAMRSFGEFANDQYQDAIALLAALATRVAAAADGYLQSNRDNAARMTDFLTNSTYRSAETRPG